MADTYRHSWFHSSNFIPYCRLLADHVDININNRRKCAGFLSSSPWNIEIKKYGKKIWQDGEISWKTLIEKNKILNQKPK